jgi:DNA-binding CsgD family transcriptional regulator
MELYINNEYLFRNFLGYFKDKAKNIILRGERERSFVYTCNPTSTASTESILDLKPLTCIHPKNLYITHNNVCILISYRQTQCLLYMSKGYSVKEIANFLGIGHKAIEFHIATIKEKTGCYYKSELIKLANKNFMGQYVSDI